MRQISLLLPALLAVAVLLAQTFTNRQLMCVCMGIVALWPALDRFYWNEVEIQFRAHALMQIPRALRFQWTAVCTVNAVFPALCTVGQCGTWPVWATHAPIAALITTMIAVRRKQWLLQGLL